MGNTPQISEILGIDRSVFYLLSIPGIPGKRYTRVYLVYPWYTKGYADAQFNLGMMYEKGQGVEQSYEKAVEYFTMAAAQWYAGAQCNLGLMFATGQGVEESLAIVHVNGGLKQQIKDKRTLLNSWKHQKKLNEEQQHHRHVVLHVVNQNQKIRN